MTRRRFDIRVVAAASSIAIVAGLQQAPAAEVRACGVERTGATVIRGAQPAYPAIAALRGDSGTVYVQVDLLPTGKLAGASIARSSGNPYLDSAALDAARASEFQAETRNCTPVAGSYMFLVGFDQ